VEAIDSKRGNRFVFVAGTGKSYPKADLLEAAQSARMVYLQQADSASTVRV
jgi:hypothetical protein